MMRNLKFSILLLLLVIGVSAYGQNKQLPNGELLVATIDSIAKAKNIKYGEVKVLQITNVFDKVDTIKKELARHDKFRFEGQFLVIDKKYFNINKLLYFEIEYSRIVFFFEAY